MTIFYDFKTRRTAATRALHNLRPGDEPYVHDHTGYSIDFPTWISQQRIRQCRDFDYEEVADSSNKYRIFLRDAPSKADTLNALNAVVFRTLRGRGRSAAARKWNGEHASVIQKTFEYLRSEQATVRDAIDSRLLIADHEFVNQILQALAVTKAAPEWIVIAESLGIKFKAATEVRDLLREFLLFSEKPDEAMDPVSTSHRLPKVKSKRRQTRKANQQGKIYEQPQRQK